MSRIKCPQCGSKLKKKEVTKDGLCPYCEYNLPKFRPKPIENNIDEESKNYYEGLRCPEDRLFIDFTSSKDKIKLEINIEGFRFSDILSSGQIKSYNLNYGEYIVSLKIGRKRYEQYILIAPGDEPIRIHCKRNRVATITIEQSEYAKKISQKRIAPRRRYDKIDRLQNWYIGRWFLILGLFLSPGVLFLIIMLIAWITGVIKMIF